MMFNQQPNKLHNADDGLSMPQQENPELLQQQNCDFAQQLQGKNIILMVGALGSGKTTALGSMLYAMQCEEASRYYGEFEVKGFDEQDSYFQEGQQWWRQVQKDFINKRFPSRSRHGNIIQIHAKFTPNGSSMPQDFVFLEMAGESVLIRRPNGATFPIALELLLKIKSLRFVFLITASYDKNNKNDDDFLICDFMDQLKSKAPFRGAKDCFMLITKWDINREKVLKVEKFFKDKMRFAANRLFESKDLQAFSVGTVSSSSPDTPYDMIDEFDYEAAQRLFIKISKKFTESGSMATQHKSPELSVGTSEIVPTEKDHAQPSNKSVFVVHGHDSNLRVAVENLLRKLNLIPVIIQDQPGNSKSIIEKIEHYSNVAYAIVLLTPDDRGGTAATPFEEQRFRARQNVILELGLFLGLLSRRRTLALCVGDLEIPSDYNGVEFKRVDTEGAWHMKLAKELKAAGLEIDLNQVL